MALHCWTTSNVLVCTYDNTVGETKIQSVRRLHYTRSGGLRRQQNMRWRIFFVSFPFFEPRINWERIMLETDGSVAQTGDMHL